MNHIADLKNIFGKPGGPMSVLLHTRMGMSTRCPVEDRIISVGVCAVGSILSTRARPRYQIQPVHLPVHPQDFPSSLLFRRKLIQINQCSYPSSSLAAPTANMLIPSSSKRATNPNPTNRDVWTSPTAAFPGARTAHYLESGPTRLH